MGALSDRVGRRPMIGACGGTLPAAGLPALHPGRPGHVPRAADRDADRGPLQSLYTGTIPVILSELFPTRVRYTALSFSYGFSVAIFGGFAPFVGAVADRRDRQPDLAGLPRHGRGAGERAGDLVDAGAAQRAVGVAGMAVRRVGVIINGATGRMGTTQHLAHLLAIAAEGGLPLRNGDRLVAGAGAGRARRGAAAGVVGRRMAALRWTTSLDEALAGPARDLHGLRGHGRAARRGCGRRSPRASTSISRSRPRPRWTRRWRWRARPMPPGLKHGVIQDKLFLPGFAKLHASSRTPASSAASCRSGRRRLLGVRRVRRSPASARAGTTRRPKAAGSRSI